MQARVKQRRRQGSDITAGRQSPDRELLTDFAGGGPAAVEQIRRQRNEPIERYERERRDYEQRRTQGIELAERRAEREATTANRAAELQYEREFDTWVKKTGVRNAESKERLRQVFELEKLREQERIGDERVAAQQRALDDRQIRAYQFKLINEEDAPSHIAKQIAEFLITGKPLSQAAEKWRSPRAAKLQAQLARLTGGGGAGGAGGSGLNAKAQKAWDMFEDIKQQVIQREQVGDSAGAEQLRRKMISVHNSLASRFPAAFELGYGDREGKWPYVKPRQGQEFSAPSPGRPGPQGQSTAESMGIPVIRDQMYFDLRGGGPSVGPQAQPQGPTEAEVQQYAQAYGVTPEVARKELMEMRQQ